MNILSIDIIHIQVILKITLQKVVNIFKITSSSPNQKNVRYDLLFCSSQ